MSDVLAINSVNIDLVATNTTVDLLVPFVKGGIPELHFTRIVQKQAALPDSWSLKPCTLTMSGTLRFAGDVQGYVDRWMGGVGWIREYRALGLINRAGYIPVTDAVSLTDTSAWNLSGDDPNFVGSRAGQAVGQIVAAILQMATNAVPLASAGVGAYTSMGPPTLPLATLQDLAALTIIPPWPVRISGERILQTLESFIQSLHPNSFLHVQPDGTIRILDSRAFTPTTLTLGSDPRLGMPALTRDASDNFSQVEIRGNTLVQAAILQTQPWPGSTATDGGLQEDFAHDGLNNAAAKAAWVPSDWSQPNQLGAAWDAGTCTVLDTTHIRVTSSNTSIAWGVDALAQGSTELLGQLILYSDALGGLIQQTWQARIIANTAMSAGGTSILTIDNPVPNTSYGGYQIFAIAAGANIVGRKYKVTNPAIGAAMLNDFPYPVPYVTSTGTSATMVSAPAATVMWPAFGTTPPYNTGIDGITLDPTNGIIWLDKPAQVVAGGLSSPPIWPANVQVFIPVAVGTLAQYAPSPTTYAGTLFSVEGVRRTKVITVPEWKDYSNNLNMAQFAAEMLDSLKDVVVEGVVPYYGLLSAYLSPGNAVSIAGNGYTTGWESLALPVVSAEIAFQSGEAGTSYLTTLHLSNRRGRYSSENFLRPNVSREQFGGSGDSFGAGLRSSQQQSQQLHAESLRMTREGTRDTAGFTGDRTDQGATLSRGFDRSARQADLSGAAAGASGALSSQAQAAGSSLSSAAQAQAQGFDRAAAPDMGGPIQVTPIMPEGGGEPD